MTSKHGGVPPGCNRSASCVKRQELAMETRCEKEDTSDISGGSVPNRGPARTLSRAAANRNRPNESIQMFLSPQAPDGEPDRRRGARSV